MNPHLTEIAYILDRSGSMQCMRNPHFLALRSVNPHFLALRSVPMALSGASRRKQIPSSKSNFLAVKPQK